MSEAGAYRSGEANPSANFADQARGAGKQAADAAADLGQATIEAAKKQASQAAEAAKDIASEAGDRLQDEAMGRKHQAADYIDRLADAMRRAAGEFEPDLPIAASCIRSAAAQVETASTSVRNGNFNDLLENAQSFARTRPTVFIGLTALAGFGLVRFLKSSGQAAPKSQAGGSSRYDYH